MTFLSRLIAQHRGVAWGLLLLLSIAPTLGWLGWKLAENERDHWTSDDDRAVLDEVRQNFSDGFSGAGCTLVLESEDFFEQDRMDAVRDLTIRLEQMNRGNRVIWLGSIPQVTFRGPRPVLPPRGASQQVWKEAKPELMEHPLIRGHLLSEDGRTMLVYVKDVPDDTIDKLREVAVEAMEGTGVRVRLTGLRPIWQAQKTAFDQDSKRIMYIAMVFIVVLAMLIFRRLSAITAACLGPGLGLFWTVGLQRLLGEPHNELVEIILPVMLMLIGFTDAVHLVAHIRQSCTEGRERSEAAGAAVRHVGLACLLTSLTTAIGFGSLMLSEGSVVVNGFGRSSAIGVLVTFLAVILITPLFCTTWLARNIHKGTEQQLTNRWMNQLSAHLLFLSRHSRIVAIAGIAVTVIFSITALQLTPDDRLGHRIANDFEAYEALVHCDEALGGIRQLRVVIKWKDSTDSDFVWEAVRQVDAVVEQEDLFSYTMSIAKVLAILPGEQGPQKLGLVGLIPPELRHQFWNSDKRQAQVTFRIQDRGLTVYGDAIERLEDQLRELEESNPQLEFHLTGEALIATRTVQGVVQELMKSLLVAAVIIFLVLTLAFRSLRYGLLSLIPNLFPLAATGAIRYLMDPSLDIASACSFAVCLGIAVDDTIHFLSRYKYEREQGASNDAAIQATFRSVGSALTMTTIVLLAGFVSVLTSQLPTHFLFAAMACATIGSAWFGDLIILPALLSWFGPEDDSSASESTQAVTEQ